MAKRLRDGRWVVTPREAEVLAAICRGMDTKAIARELGISGSTVKVHVARLQEMAPAESRLQLAVMTWERGGEVFDRRGEARRIPLGRGDTNDGRG